MNQILSIEDTSKNKNKSKNRKGPAEIKSIVRFFSISILILGIFFIGTASYSMYTTIKNVAETTNPTISVNRTTDTSISIQVKHDKNVELEKVIYSWNGKDEIEIAGNGRKSIQEEIQIPDGTNTFKIYAKDVNGQETSYERQYTGESNIVINEFEASGSKLKITATGKEEISYMTYRWDEEEEKKIEINSTELEEEVDIPKGEHTITVVMVDKNNITVSKEQKVKGVTKPKVEVSTDGSANFIIRASDEEALKKVEFIINETEKYMLNLDGRKELEYAYPLKDGENKIEVTVYNASDVSSTFRARLTK